MNSQHRQHLNWQPVRKLYYKKYYNVVRTGTHPTHQKIDLPKKFAKEYRIVDRFVGIQPDDNGNNAFTNIASVYTNNEELIQYILKYYEVTGIETPYNQTHLDYLLDTNREIIYRDKAWYDQYHHKVRIFESWRSRASVNKAKPMEVLYIFDELFKRIDSRWNGQGRDHSNLWSHSRYFSYPTIYTNNEPSIMLLKMSYNSMLSINVETVVTPDFLK
jgi:hypothetical protein